jgi:hypothetical protein
MIKIQEEKQAPKKTRAKKCAVCQERFQKEVLEKIQLEREQMKNKLKEEDNNKRDSCLC